MIKFDFTVAIIAFFGVMALIAWIAFTTWASRKLSRDREYELLIAWAISLGGIMPVLLGFIYGYKS